MTTYQVMKMGMRESLFLEIDDMSGSELVLSQRPVNIRWRQHGAFFF